MDENNLRIAADYTTRSNYQDNYRKSNRDAINARKRAWRKAKKSLTIPEIRTLVLPDNLINE